jgi:hypothetical protein
MDTLFLNPDDWDLDVDAAGNIAVSSLYYAIAQDVASQGLVWRGEPPFATNDGIPYEGSILGLRPSNAEMAAWYKVEAEKVPGVASATAILRYNTDRSVTGQIQITTDDGAVINV